MKTAVDSSTVQTIVATQSSAFSQEPIQDTNAPSGLFVGGGLLVGGLVLAIALRCCVRPWRLPLGEAQIAATNHRKRRRRRIVPQSLRLRRTHKVGTSDRHSRPHINSYTDSSWSSDNSSSCTSYDSSPSSWSSDSSSSCTSYDSSSSASSDSSSSCTSYDSSSSSSDCGGGSSGGSGAGSDW
jgi:uncharacterized membrane protein YgcG